MVVASVHRSGEKRAIRRMRPGVRGQRSAEVEPAKPLERCAFFCRAAFGETVHLKAMAEDRNPDTNILLRLPRTLSQSYGVLVGRPDIDPPRCRYDSKVSTRSDQHALPASLFPSGTESALCSLARASITAQSRTGAPPRQDWAMRSSSASSARR
jgi:hypothetical protein